METRALLFDFDGLLVESEPLHCEGFRRVCEAHGVALSEADYFTHFIGFDDRDAFRGMFERGGRARPEGAELGALVAEKAGIVEQLMGESLSDRPGARAFVEGAVGAFHMGVCSGALRHEVRLGLEHLGLADILVDVVAAEDVAHGKPDPEGYEALRAALSARAEALGEAAIQPGECVVLEDTSHGLMAGRGAGCRTVGVVGTESREALERQADLVLDTLEGLDAAELARTLEAKSR